MKSQGSTAPRHASWPVWPIHYLGPERSSPALELPAGRMDPPIAGCTTVSGIDSVRVLRQNLRIARRFTPMSAREQREYERSLAEYAADGRFELYKTTAEHDGAVG